MFGSVLLLVAALLHVYVFWRAASVPLVRRRISRRALFVLGGVLWIGSALARLWGHDGTGILAAAVELVGMTWVATLFLASVCLLVVDLLTGFGLLLTRLAPRLRGWALLAGAALSAVALVQGLRPPVARSYEVQVPGLPAELDGTVLVAMSDLHLGSLLGDRWLAERVSQVQELRPDLVVLLGDLIEGHGRPRNELLAGLDSLSAPMGVWAVPGNHESYGERDGDSSFIEQSHIRMLENRWAQVRPGLVLAGVKDLTTARRTGEGDEFVAKALADRPSGATFLLSHTPWRAEQAASRGVGLMLSGHTHGGQIWPLGYLVGLRYPLLEGRYDVNGMTMIVCRGTGTWGPRMRLWRPGEILRITLRSDEK